MRGAIAVALAENVRTEHKDVIVSSTLMVVFITTILLGFSTAPILKWLNLYEPEEVRSYQRLSVRAYALCLCVVSASVRAYLENCVFQS